MKIGISGKQGAGKTALAKILIEKYNFQKVSFADGVKNTGMQVFGLTYDQAFGNSKDRVLLQQIGQKLREIDPNVWVNMVVREIKKSDKVIPNVVIDDVRFKNEFDTLRENGFIMVRIDASEDIRKERIGSTFANPTHISETDLDAIGVKEQDDEVGWDVFINNSASLETLEKFAATIVRTFSSDKAN